MGTILAYALALRAWDADPQVLQQQEEQVARQLQHAEAREHALMVECDLAERKLLAAQAVGEQPDWSILLAVLAGKTESEVMLKQCGLVCDDQENGETNGGPSLRLAACGASQQTVSQFVLSMEDTRLFREVKLLRSTREPFGDTEIVAFELVCTLATEETAP